MTQNNELEMKVPEAGPIGAGEDVNRRGGATGQTPDGGRR